MSTTRVLIVKLGSIGDVVHTLPAAALLRRSLPEASIAWVVEPTAAPILEGSPAIDELIEIDTRSWRKDLLRISTNPASRAGLDQLRRTPGSNGAGDTDTAIDFQGLIKSGLVALASRAPRRLGFETRDLREKPSKIFLTEQIETAEFTHVIDKNLALARAAIRNSADRLDQRAPGTSTSYEFPIAISDCDERYVESFVGKQPGEFAIINPGGGWTTKLWPADRYAEIADWLWSECGLASVVTVGPGEEELAARVNRASRSGKVRTIESTLKQFVALTRRAKLFIGGDTGPLHLAAASGTPTVGLYGPTSPERNGPFDPRDVTVGRDLWCRADCHRRGCWHWECMDIPINDVKRAVLKRLANTKEERAD